MLDDLTKTFFDTFGIEPDKWCKIGIDKDGNFYKEPIDKRYPQITDRILLELICLCPDLDEVFFTDIVKLKETLLTSYIKIYKYYTEVERLSDCGKELKQQVQALFKE